MAMRLTHTVPCLLQMTVVITNEVFTMQYHPYIASVIHFFIRDTSLSCGWLIDLLKILHSEICCLIISTSPRISRVVERRLPMVFISSHYEAIMFVQSRNGAVLQFKSQETKWLQVHLQKQDWSSSLNFL